MSSSSSLSSCSESFDEFVLVTVTSIGGASYDDVENQDVP